MLRSFYRYRLREDIASYIRKCDIFAADKKPIKTSRVPLASFRAGAPGNRLTTDYLGPLPEMLDRKKATDILTPRSTWKTTSCYPILSPARFHIYVLCAFTSAFRPKI